jgi:alkylation response protein AidB-like acyl-CoA dehydrogenase
METYAKTAIKGGEFLIRETKAQDIFIPEEFNEEQRMMAQTCYDFLDAHIYPNIARIDNMEDGLMKSIVEEAGNLGLLGVAVPEEYGGMGMNFVTNLLFADVIGSSGSFSTTYGAHTGIGTLPILYYGTEAQKQHYLPKLVSGEWKA